MSAPTSSHLTDSAPDPPDWGDGPAHTVVQRKDWPQEWEDFYRKSFPPQPEIALPDYEGDHHEGFWMPTRCWVEQYGPLLTLNERRGYDLLALYYNQKQMRSFPKNEQIVTYFAPDDSEWRRSRSGMAKLGLVEWWSEPVGQRHSRRFFRMPHVGKKGRHFAVRKQPSAHELLELRERGELPEGYEWLESQGVRLLTPRVTAEDVLNEIGRRVERWNSGRRR